MKPPACAACRHQRRRCRPDCPLAPFFPPEKAKDFEAAHKLFGVHNIVNNLKKIIPEQKPESITSMVYEANARVRDPVSGCTGIISRLLQNINAVKVELEFVQAQVACFHTLHQQLGDQNVVDNVGFVDFLQENSSANIVQSLNQDFNFLYENLQNPQQLQESSFALETKLFDGVHQGISLSIGKPAVKPERRSSSSPSSSKAHGKQPLQDSGLPRYFCCVVWALGPWLTERDSQGNVIISIGVDNQYSMYLHCKKKMLHSSVP
ncbi:hypothetical protein NC652_039450 [Populus alba x Populus x berolinensis]|nr:hypothetical protein NC652_039450 [Populus alba x Populus x berolinensis]